MAKIVAFADLPSGIQIEVDSTSPGGGTPSAAALVEALTALVARVAQLDAAQRPTDLTITFGLRALESGDFAITLDTSPSNLQVSLSWRQEPGISMPDLPVPPG